MRDVPEPEGAAARYAVAHSAHYSAGDLRRAIELYELVVVGYPDTREAGYSRAQIENIVRAVVPEQERLEAGVALALARLERTEARET